MIHVNQNRKMLTHYMASINLIFELDIIILSNRR